MPDSAAEKETTGTPKVGALIRARRQQLKMTLSDLGAASSVSVGYLSQVERDQATPSLGTLTQVSRALDVGVEYFIAAPSAQEALSRAEQRPKFSINGSSIVYERLGAEFPGSTLSSYILTVPPGYRSEMVSHEGEEILYILEGEISQRVDDAEFVMRAGDSLHFRGNRPHAWKNNSEKPAKLFWAGTLAMFRTGNDKPSV
ncbi:helix-turn-helix domain-containing protein [Rhizobium setariae]|uniref:helix-turn-helix domain-containing protein n=1 Tax=Rhizobium setariae TaxID=2801340 RepID=UPI001FEEA7EA|nr:XRE family transcriptional regulator [Rhizobium setariae]